MGPLGAQSETVFKRIDRLAGGTRTYTERTDAAGNVTTTFTEKLNRHARQVDATSRSTIDYTNHIRELTAASRAGVNLLDLGPAGSGPQPTPTPTPANDPGGAGGAGGSGGANRNRDFARSADDASRSGTRMRTMLIGLAAALSPGLIPILAVATAGVVAFAGGLTAAVAGGLLFGGAMLTNIAPVFKALKDYGKDGEAAFDKLDAGQRKIAHGLIDVKNQWKSLADGVRPQSYAVASLGLTAVSNVLSRLQPLLKVSADAFVQVAQGIERATRSPSFQKFIDFLTRQAGPAILFFAKLLGNLFATLGNLLQAFEPIIKPVEQGLLRFTDNWRKSSAALTTNQGFQKFLAYARENAPIVGRLLKDLWDGVTALGAALARMGVGTVEAVSALLRFIKAIADSKGFRELADQLGRIEHFLAPLIDAFARFYKRVLDSWLVVQSLRGAGDGLVLVIRALTPLVNFLADHLWIVAAACAGVLLPLLGIAAAGRVVREVVAHAGDALRLMGRAAQDVGKFLQALPGILTRALPGAANWLLDVGKHAASGIWNGIAAGLVASFKIGERIGRAVAGVFTGLPGWISDAISRIPDLVGKFFHWMTGLPGQVTGWLKSVNWVEIGKKIVGAIVDGLGAAWRNKATVGKIALGIASMLFLAMAAIPFLLLAVGVALVAGVVTGIVKGLTPAGKAVGRFFVRMWQTVYNDAIGPVIGVFAGIGRVLGATVGVALRGITTAWRALAAGFKLYWDYFLHPVLNAFWQVAWRVAVIVISFALLPLKLAFLAMVISIKWAWEHILRPAWNGIVIGARLLWLGLSIVFRFIGSLWSALVFSIRWFWDHVLRPTWNAVSAVARWLWGGLSLIFRAIAAGWGILVGGVRWVWDHILRPTWDAVYRGARWLWDNGLRPIFKIIGEAWHGLALGFQWVNEHVFQPVWDAIKGAVEGVRLAFRSAVDAIRGIWNEMRKIVAAPYNDVIAPVVEWLAKGVDTVTKFVLNSKPLEFAEKLPRYAGGGVAPGDRPILVGEQGPEIVTLGQTSRVYPAHESARITDTGGIGGFVPGFGKHAAKHTLEKVPVVGTAFKAAEWFADEAAHLLRIGAANALDAAYGALSGPLRKLIGDGGVGKAGMGGIDKVEKSFIEWMRGKEETLGGDYDAGPLGGAVQAIIDVMRSSHIPFGVNSAFRPGDPGFHGSGNAVDFGGDLPRIAGFWADRHASLLELIYGNGWQRNVKNGQLIGDGIGYYGAATVAHHGGGNAHVHVAAKLAAMQELLHPGSSGFGGGFGGAVAAGSIQSIAMQLLNQRGWGNQWGAFKSIVDRESGWDPTISNGGGHGYNPGRAYGIPQALPGSKMAAAGADWRTNPTTQLRWMMNYIASVYHDPNGAWAHWQRAHSYDTGGPLHPGQFGYNGTGETEFVYTADQNRRLHARARAHAGGGGDLIIEDGGVRIDARGLDEAAVEARVISGLRAYARERADRGSDGGKVRLR